VGPSFGLDGWGKFRPPPELDTRTSHSVVAVPTALSGPNYR